MEDMINALLDVVRAQHTAAEGTDTEPFDMDDIVDMALNILGRPDEEEEKQEVVSNIEEMVHSLAPDLFPPKTFEELDDQGKIQSAANMIEQSLRSGTVGRVSIPSVQCRTVTIIIWTSSTRSEGADPFPPSWKSTAFTTALSTALSKIIFRLC